MKSLHILQRIFITAAAVVLINGCTPTLTKSDAEEVVTKFYEAMGYKVTELSIGKIDSTPFSENKYMGTPGFMVDVTSITVRKVEDTGDIWTYSEGEKVTFKNARVLIRLSPDRDKQWEIVYVSGIDVH